MSTALARRAQLAAAVAEAVTRVPGVARLSPGSGLEVAVQYRGGKVVGIELTDRRLAIHVVIDRLPLVPVAEAIRRQVDEVLAGWADGETTPTVDVVIEDVDLDDLPQWWGAQPVADAAIHGAWTSGAATP
jgi:hypothetical protein